MQSNIDKIVKSTAQKEPMPQGHEQRFLEKLKQRQQESPTPKTKPKPSKLTKKRVLTIVMGAAAVVLVMFTFLKPSGLLQSEVECDEICEFINYSDNSLYSLQSDLTATAILKLLPEEVAELKKDLGSMIDEYNESKEQQNVMNEEEFLGFIYSVYQQQVESITYIAALLN